MKSKNSNSLNSISWLDLVNEVILKYDRNASWKLSWRGHLRKLLYD